MGLPQTFSVTAAALHAGLHPSTIYRWITTGFLPARKRFRGRGFEIADADLERVKNIPARGKDRGKRTPKRPYYLRALAKKRDKRGQ